jgi:phage baseplate assembly protein V
MSAEVADLQRRLANLFRVGKIVEINRTTGRVKVKFGDVTSPWMPWSTSRAGDVKNWSPPAVGEQVCICSPFGELGSGFVMPGAINSEANAAPDNREDVEKITLPSGGAYEITVGSTTLIYDNGKVQIVAGGKTFQISGGKATFNGDLEVTGKITATGNIESQTEVKAGSIALTTHRHGGVQPGGGTTSTPVP